MRQMRRGAGGIVRVNKEKGIRGNDGSGIEGSMEDERK